MSHWKVEFRIKDWRSANIFLLSHSKGAVKKNKAIQVSQLISYAITSNEWIKEAKKYKR